MIKKLYALIPSLPYKTLPTWIIARTDPERFSIDDFVHNTVVPNITEKDLLLDAGAGFGRYRKELSKAQYVATDFAKIFHADSQNNMDFVCSLDNIPQKDNTYDVIVNTQVLEHVEFPQKVMCEFNRVLKPGGRLFLTTNQTWMVHGAPFNFYFYTKYGLASLLKEAGFETVFIKPRGGMLWVFAKFINILPQYLFYQLCYGSFKREAYKKPQLRHPIRAAILYIPYVLAQWFISIPIPFILFFCDKLDHQKDATLGYSVFATKKAS